MRFQNQSILRLVFAGIITLIGMGTEIMSMLIAMADHVIKPTTTLPLTEKWGLRSGLLLGLGAIFWEVP